MSDSSYNDGSPESSEPDFAFGIDDRAREWPSAPAAAAVDWFHLADRLSRLGTLLWLHRNGSSDGAFPRARLLPRGVLLLDHPALNAFSICIGVEAHNAVGAQGPREWLEFLDAQSTCVARLYLLPDSDYLAWDAMLNDCGISRVASQVSPRWRACTAFMRSLARQRSQSSWQARAVRFPLLRLPCLHVLGLRAPTELSELGRQLAATIAGDEGAHLNLS